MQGPASCKVYGMDSAALSTEQKIARMVMFSGLREPIIRETAKHYFEKRSKGASCRKAHTSTTELAARLLGTREQAWDYATCAQNLIDAQMVEF